MMAHPFPHLYPVRGAVTTDTAEYRHGDPWSPRDRAEAHAEIDPYDAHNPSSTTCLDVLYTVSTELYCTRAKDHNGDHAASSGDLGASIVGRWKQIGHPQAGRYTAPALDAKCRRCGAVSASGIYCPSGCGRI